MDQSASPQVVTNTAPTASSSTNYASFSRRLVALFIDGFILGTIYFAVFTPVFILLSLNFSPMMGNTSSNPYQMYESQSQNAASGTMYSLSMLVIQLLSIVLSYGYSVFFIGKKGQTPGMMLLHIKAIKEQSGTVPGYGAAILRTVVAQFLSGPILGLGYLWVLWDSKKQTWHDKIAQTVVVKV